MPRWLLAFLLLLTLPVFAQRPVPVLPRHLYVAQDTDNVFTGSNDFSGARATAPVKSGPLALRPLLCRGGKDMYLVFDPPEPPQLQVCNVDGVSWTTLTGSSVPGGELPSPLTLGIVSASSMTVGSAVLDSSSPISPKRYGAKGDGTTDDSAAIQAAIDAALARNNGGEVVLSSGLYRTTVCPLNVGLPIFDSFAWLSDRVAPIDDPTYSSHVISANVTANDSKPGVTIRFEDGAAILADCAPSVPTPVIAYNLRNGDGRIINAHILGTTAVSGGKEVIPTVSASNKLIGIVAALGAKSIEYPRFVGLQHGVVSAAGYWSSIIGVRCYRGTGTCLNLAGANAVTAANVLARDMGAGTVYDGDASLLYGLHTQQVGLDLVLFRADSTIVSGAYFEDVETADGTGTYAVTLGTAQNQSQVLHTVLQGIRVGHTRPGKKAFRVWSSKNLQFIGSRSFGRGIDTDTASYGVIQACDGGDFDNTTALPPTNWIRPANAAGGSISASEITNSGEFYQQDNLYVKSATANTGYAQVVPGTATTTARYEWYDPAGLRIAYAGDDANNFKIVVNKGQGKFVSTGGFSFDGKVAFNNPLKLASVAAYTCNSSVRGEFNFIAGDTGVRDIVQACIKDELGNYAWRTMVQSPLQQGQTVTTGSIAASSSAAVTLTWAAAFADANYAPSCSVIDATATTSTLRVHHIESVLAASVTARVVNDDGAGAHTGTLSCTAIHP